jgi:hypothetical protein
MSRISRYLLILLLLMWVGNASAATVYNQWAGVTDDWNTASNWATGYVPFIDDGLSQIKAGFKGPETAWPLITSSTLPVPEADVITLGGSTPGFLRIDSGALNVGQYITMAASSTEDGTFYINGGTISTGLRTSNAHLFVGQQGVGTVQMTGGTVDLIGGLGSGNLRIAYTATASGNVHLDGGTIYANDLQMLYAAPGALEIDGGTLVLKGDDEAAVDALISGGLITTTIVGNYVDAVYDGSEYTTVSSVPEPATICLLGFGVLGLLGKKK